MSVSSIGDVVSELLKLAKTSIATYGEYVKAEKGNPPASPEVVAQLRAAAETARSAFDRRLSEVVGTDRQRSKDWNFAVQKAYVFGMVGDNIFRYVHGDGDLARSLMNQARAYLNGHKALGWAVEHGLNPRSVQTLERALTNAEQKAVESCDVNRLQPIRAALSELRRHCENLLKSEVRNAPPQPKQATTSLGEAMAAAQKATAETPQPTAAPRPRNARRGR
jgi:hypothetical protein